MTRVGRIANRPTVRRLLVTIGVAGSLLVAGATIRAAALWAANEAPLMVAPVSVDSVQQALDQERGRSAALEAQLAELEASTSGLTAALTAANARLGTDQASADELRASLTAAQKRLAKLEAALKAAAAKRAGAVVTTTTTTRSGGSDDEREDEDDHEDEHDD